MYYVQFTDFVLVSRFCCLFGLCLTLFLDCKTCCLHNKNKQIGAYYGPRDVAKIN